MRFRNWVGLCVVALALAGCAGLAGEPAIVSTLPPQPTTPAQTISLPQSAPDLALGAQVFAENCTRCHGAAGKGDGEMVQSGQVTGVPDFTNPLTTQGAAPIAWYEVVTNGRLDKLMPPWGGKLSEAQRWAVTMYVYTLANTPNQLKAGESVWGAKCADCHGKTGEGTAKGAPLPNLLQASNADLLKLLVEGIPDKMPSFEKELSADDQTAVIAYSRMLTLKNAGGASQQVAAAPTAADTTAEPATTPNPDAGAATTGLISGKVTNKSAGGTVPSDLTLNLHVISDQNTTAPNDILQAKINSDNTYRFEKVPLQAGWQYVVTASYKGTAFNSEVVNGDPTKPQIDLPLNIYDVAADPSGIQVSGILTMVQPSQQQNQLEVVQIYNFTNASDRVFLKQENGTPSSVSVRLPKGAAFEDFSNGSYLISADGTQVTDTQPVLPGDSHVMHVAFTLPYFGGVAIDQPLDYQLNGQVEVMSGVDALSIVGDGFSGLGTRQLGNRVYTSYGGQLSRNAGEALRYQIQGPLTSTQASAPAAATNNLSPIAYILIGAGLLSIGAAFGFFMRERVTPARAAVQESANPQINALIKKIADLDAQYSDRKISKTKYQKQRTALKAQVVALMKAEGGTPDAPPPSAES
jgi:mono/diheme cytochrome c family protein